MRGPKIQRYASARRDSHYIRGDHESTPLDPDFSAAAAAAAVAGVCGRSLLDVLRWRLPAAPPHLAPLLARPPGHYLGLFPVRGLYL